MKTIKQIVIGCLLVVGIVFGYNLWMEYCLDDSNPNNYATIGDIPAPEGYIRVKQVPVPAFPKMCSHGDRVPL